MKWYGKYKLKLSLIDFLRDKKNFYMILTLDNQPYGKPYINQHLSSYNELFTSTGKERDEETGYGYFGARYMDHELMTMWLSVDPMADKYPSISPYAYCSWNPMKLVDPNSKEIFYKEGRSYFMYQKNAEGVYDFYNCRTGELYAGANREYVDDLTKSLNQLKEGKYGNKLAEYQDIKKMPEDRI